MYFKDSDTTMVKYAKKQKNRPYKKDGADDRQRSFVYFADRLCRPYKRDIDLTIVRLVSLIVFS